MISLLLVAVVAAGGNNAPCPHPYFPIEEGLKLTYQAGRAEVPVSYSEVKTKDDELTGVLEMVVRGRPGRTEARCTRSGIITGDGGLEGLALRSSSMDITIEKTEGVMLPPPSELTPGKSWRNTFTVKMKPPSSMTESGGLKGAFSGALVMSTTITKEATVIGPEKVTTKAGTFDAIKVSNKTIASGGKTGGAQRSMESIMWLAPNLGIVKIMTGESVDFELLKVERGARAEAK